MRYPNEPTLIRKPCNRQKTRLLGGPRRRMNRSAGWLLSWPADRDEFNPLHHWRSRAANGSWQGKHSCSFRQIARQLLQDTCVGSSDHMTKTPGTTHVLRWRV